MGGQYPKCMYHTSHICTDSDRSCWIKHNTTLRRPQDLFPEAGYHNTSFTLHSTFDAPDPLWRRWVTNTPNACTSCPTSALVLIGPAGSSTTPHSGLRISSQRHTITTPHSHFMESLMLQILPGGGGRPIPHMHEPHVPHLH